MATTINANNTDGVVITPDTSGELELQANGVTKAKVTANGLQDANGNSLRGGMYRNLIINGDMRIDQRNSGSEINPVANNTYSVDRWNLRSGTTSLFKFQQNAGSVTPPEDFTNYLGITSLSSHTVGATEISDIRQGIEGQNIAHLKWGTADAKTVTVSFWVRSSLTGTFGASLSNTSANRCYPFSYSITSANTWEKKTITIDGDTTGTWSTDNTIGIRITFSLGTGTTYSGTSGAWTSSLHLSVTGATSLVGTSGATLYITGVQLEVGEGASDFEFLPYDVQLARCQRYFQTIGSFVASTISTNQTVVVGCYSLYCPMRADPSLYTFNGSFHKPGVAFYTISSFSSLQNYQGNSYTTFNIASGAGSGVDGNYNGTLQLQAEL